MSVKYHEHSGLNWRPSGRACYFGHHPLQHCFFLCVCYWGVSDWLNSYADFDWFHYAFCGGQWESQINNLSSAVYIIALFSSLQHIQFVVISRLYLHVVWKLKYDRRDYDHTSRSWQHETAAQSFMFCYILIQSSSNFVWFWTKRLDHTCNAFVDFG